MQIALALTITVVSAFCLNLGYLLQHGVASKLPALSLRRPVASLRSLLGNLRWLAGIGVEAVGWLLYVAALALVLTPPISHWSQLVFPLWVLMVSVVILVTSAED